VNSEALINPMSMAGISVINFVHEKFCSISKVPTIVIARISPKIPNLFPLTISQIMAKNIPVVLVHPQIIEIIITMTDIKHIFFSLVSFMG
jgi:hypothetical protein